MKKALILLADGFEEIEALSSHDIFKRTHEIEPVLVSIKDDLMVMTSSGIYVKADAYLKDLDLSSFSFIVLPGGKVGVDNLKASSEVKNAIALFRSRGLGVYAICAAPSILAELGYLDNASYTCFPGFQIGKGNYTGDEVTVDGDWITGRSMAYSIPFAEAIVKKELGDEALRRIAPGTRGKE